MAEIEPALAERIARARGFIFDMDGTIALGDAASGGHRALPDAIALFAALRRRGTPLRVFTNGTAKPPAAYAASLRGAGFDLADEEMLTPSSAAAAWFVERGVRRVRVLGVEGVAAPLAEAGIEIIGPSAPASDVEAVYTGWFREFTFPDLEAACRDVWAGARLTTASHVPFFATAGGRAIGSSFAINAMIRSLTHKRATVLGKPSRAAFDVAVKGMGLPRSAAAEIVIVGDDPALEIRMARQAGAIAVGITTGLETRASFAARPERERPDHVLGGLSELLSLVG